MYYHAMLSSRRSPRSSLSFESLFVGFSRSDGEYLAATPGPSGPCGTLRGRTAELTAVVMNSYNSSADIR